jgi:O-antigen ligase
VADYASRCQSDCGAPTGLELRLLQVALVMAPFSAALTIDVGWPIKASEVAIVLALGHSFFRGRQIVLPRSVRRVVVALTALSVLAASSFLSVLLRDSLPEPDRALRFGLLGTSLSAAAFHSVPPAAFRQAARGMVEWRATTIRWWLRGTMVAVSYQLYLFLVSMSGVSAPLLPGTSTQTAGLFGFRLLRAGPTIEGNTFAAYLVVSLCIALLVGRRRLLFPIAAAIVGTVSTSGIIALFVIIPVVFDSGNSRSVDRIRSVRRVAQPVRIIFGLMTLALVGFALRSPVDAKFSSGSTSLIERTESLRGAANLISRFPVLGVGPDLFGPYFSEIRRSNPELGELAFSNGLGLINNIFLEPFVELGIGGLVVVGIVVSAFVRQARRRGGLQSGVVLIAVALPLATFPTSTSATLWLSLAVLFAALDPGDDRYIQIVDDRRDEPELGQV